MAVRYYPGLLPRSLDGQRTRNQGPDALGEVGIASPTQRYGKELLARTDNAHGNENTRPDRNSYNELVNRDGTVYAATRSTGQIEEGPVGYSITNVDGYVVSWRFVELGKLPVVVITSPSDERLLTMSSETPQENLQIRAKFWGEAEAVRATAHLGGHDIRMKQVENSQVWEANVSASHEGIYSLGVSAVDAREDV